MTEEGTIGIKIKCKNCNNKQEYNLRNSEKIPNRPKTQCQNCGTWIYIDKDLLNGGDIGKEHDKALNFNWIEERDTAHWIQKTIDEKLKRSIDERLLKFVKLGLRHDIKQETLTNVLINQDYIKDALITMEDTRDRLDKIRKTINYIKEKEISHFRERVLQNLLRKFPQIIESNLKYLAEEYRLGETNYRGDMLFLDFNSNMLNIELKVNIPRFKDFKEQLSNYLKNIQDNERLMYIAPEITREQELFCKDNNIEVKIINLNTILKW